MIKIPQSTAKQINYFRNECLILTLENIPGVQHKLIEDYSEEELNAMRIGIYKDANYLLVGRDYFVNLNDVVKTSCELADISYLKKPKLKEVEAGYYNQIKNVRNFYIKDYYIITDKLYGASKIHDITKLLFKVGLLKKGRGQYKDYFLVSNDYKEIKAGGYPKDLFHPIKRFINGYFFENDYKISEFEVTGYHMDFLN